MGSESGEGGSCGTLGEDLQSEMEVTPTALVDAWALVAWSRCGGWGWSISRPNIWWATTHPVAPPLSIPHDRYCS
jgi:hypothetical protein